MNILIEGPDNSGKSTLARMLSITLGWRIERSPGACTSYTDFYQRCAQLAAVDNVIFDRHAIVSEKIYGGVMRVSYHDDAFDDILRRSSLIIIHCEGRDLADHVVKPHETREHVEKVELHHETICDLYQQWAKDVADFHYWVGMPFNYLKLLTYTLIEERRNGLVRRRDRLPFDVRPEVQRRATRVAPAVSEVEGTLTQRRKGRVLASR